MKTCSKCGLSQPFESFYKDGTTLRAECKQCTREVRAAYYVLNATTVKAKESQRYADGGLAKRHAREHGAPGSSAQICLSCGETKPLTAFLKKAQDGACRKCVSNAYVRDPLKQAAKEKRYVEAHHEEIKARAAQYRALNAEECRERDRARRSQKRESDRLYYAAHPEKRAARNATYHRRARAAKGKATGEQIKARFEFYGNRCAYCASTGHITADHVIPLSRGGSNFSANIRPACKPCNSSKGAKKLSEWKPELLRAA